MTTSLRRLFSLAPLVLPLVAIASCGGSTDTPPPSGETASTAGAGGSNTPGGQSGAGAAAGAGVGGQSKAGAGGSGGASAGPGAGGAAGAGHSGSGNAGGGMGGSGTAGSGTAGTGAGGAGAAGSSGEGGSGGSTSQGGNGGSGQAGTGAGGQSGAVGCANTQLVSGTDTGYFVCGDGAIHRTTKSTCPNTLPSGGNTCSEQGSLCDPSKCTAGGVGYCGFSKGGGAQICECQYGCTTDADCGSGEICLCGDVIGTCSSAACTVDADCGAGSQCMTYSIGGGCALDTAFACTTTQDECLTDEDCGSSGGFGGMVCGYDGKKRTCGPGPLACP